MNSKRSVSTSDGKLVCEEGWVPCDENGDAENTVCYEAGQKNSCPITDIVI